MIRHALALVVGATLTGVLLAPATAQAASYPPLGWKTFNPSYSKSYCFYSKPLKKGMLVTLKGTLSYKRHVYKFNRGIRIRFHDPTLKNPTITLRTYNKCGSGRKASKVSKARVNQVWYDYKCNNRVRVLLGRGSKFGISFSGTRSCGNAQVASRATSYGKGAVFEQFNTGAPVGWSWGSDGKGISKGGKICLRADAAATGYVGNSSDTVIRLQKVCVTASYS